MLGEIATLRKLQELFKATEGLIEVYADSDFKASNDTAKVYLLVNEKESFLAGTSDVMRLLVGLRECFDEKSAFYVAHSNFDIMLENKKLIWRKGKWYI